MDSDNKQLFLLRQQNIISEAKKISDLDNTNLMYHGSLCNKCNVLSSYRFINFSIDDLSVDSIKKVENYMSGRPFRSSAPLQVQSIGLKCSTNKLKQCSIYVALENYVITFLLYPNWVWSKRKVYHEEQINVTRDDGLFVFFHAKLSLEVLIKS